MFATLTVVWFTNDSTKMAVIFYHVMIFLTFIIQSSSYAMKNRYSPPSSKIEALKQNMHGNGKNHKSSSSSTSIAHHEANELLAYLTEQRRKQQQIDNNELNSLHNIHNNNKNLNISSYVNNQSHHKKMSTPFKWELENGFKEWHKPFDNHIESWQQMPDNQQYQRDLWFFKYNDSEIETLRRNGKNIEFIFGLSTGHCGTTTMSLASSYKELGYDTSNCLFGFETLAQGVRDFTRRHPSREASLNYVQRYFLPSLIEMILRTKKKCFIDFGHHVLFSHILIALKHELKNNMKIVRIRRARSPTAISYALKRKKDGPCGTRCVYCVCPEEQRVCLFVSPTNWRKFTVYMKFLWMIDEVECRWQTFLQDQRNLLLQEQEELERVESNKTHSVKTSLSLSSSVLEVNWSQDLTPHLSKFASFQGFPITSKTSSTVTKHKSHVSIKEKGLYTPSQMETEEKLYKKLMSFTPDQSKLLKSANF